eukprot:2816220-Amphidinium_carterae.1
MAQSLRENGFTSVVTQRKILTAQFRGLLSLDIHATSQLDKGTWAAQAFKSAEFFKTALPVWKKQLVCALKAILRLRFQVPGVLLEAVVHSMSPLMQADHRDAFLEAL